MDTQLSSRDKILEAAEKIFAQNGFHAASMQEIAELAQVNKAMLFYYFTNKDNLYLELLKTGMQDFGSHLEQAIASASFVKEQIEKVMAVALERIEKRREIAIIIIRELGGTGDKLKEHLDLFLQVLLPVQEVIERGIKEGVFRDLNPKLTAISLLTIMKEFAFERILLGEPSVEMVLEHTTNLLFNGLLAAPEPKRRQK